jgi:hypothetical protein
MEPVDQVPLLSYSGMPPLGSAERNLRNRGLGFATGAHVVTVEHPNVQTEYHEYSRAGVPFRRTLLRTPLGDLFSTDRLRCAYGSSWTIKHFVETPDDYRIAEFIVRDRVYQPSYDLFFAKVAEVGDDGYTVGGFAENSPPARSPLMQMRLVWLGLEQFAVDLHERPDLFFSLYEALRQKHREVYPLLARSPAHVIAYCANASPEVIGRKRFSQYILPCYNELGEQLHARGKLLSSHLDANNGLWRDLIAGSAIDVIEAFTPAPDTDMSVAEARDRKSVG